MAKVLPTAAQTSQEMSQQPTDSLYHSRLLLRDSNQYMANHCTATPGTKATARYRHLSKYNSDPEKVSYWLMRGLLCGLL